MGIRRTTSWAGTGALAAVGLVLTGCTAGSSGTAGSSSPATVVTQTTTVGVSPGSSRSDAAPTGTVPATTATTSPPGGSGGGSGATIQCTPTVSRISWTDVGGASSHDAVDIHVVNASQQPCNTIGYPGLAVLNSAGQQIEQAQRTPHGFLGGLESGDPPQLTLQPGQEATARLEWETATNGGNCPDGAAVLFTLPDNTDSTRLAIAFLTCPDGVQIHPLLAGDSGTSG